MRDMRGIASVSAAPCCRSGARPGGSRDVARARANRSVAPEHRRRTFGWVATVSHWDIKHHEVVVEFDGAHVRDLQADVRRMRGVPGDDSSPGRR